MFPSFLLYASKPAYIQIITREVRSCQNRMGGGYNVFRVDIEVIIMRLKPFDFKLPHEEAKRKKRIIFTLSAILIIVVITIASSFAYYQSIELQNPYNTSVGTFSNGDLILVVTIDGIDSQTFPTKGSGYVANSVTCDKSATGNWDNDLWTIAVSNLTQTKTICNIDFVLAPYLKDAILDQGGGAVSIQTLATSSFAKAAVSQMAYNMLPATATSQNASQANSIVQSGIYKMNDDYGVSYYYRGARENLNNNLIFAGFQWKIIRINGNGTIRIIYNGTEAQFNSANTVNVAGTNTQIELSKFNPVHNDAKYVGYMYGGANGTASTSRASAVTNQTDSTAKTTLDTWYTNNIESKGASVTNKISDTLFCNDRSIHSGTGYGSTATYYGAYNRLQINKAPILMCSDKNDRFTVSDTTIGNGALSKPVGLITADEVSLAGGLYYIHNTSYYLYSGQLFWSMTSGAFGSVANVWYIGNLGLSSYYPAGDNYGLRPILNLASTVQLTGTGTATDPFRIV